MHDRTEIDRIRERTDLAVLIGEHVALTPRGHEHVGLCPFHDDHKPSFAVVTHKGDHFYKCHSCGAAGDCFQFVQEFLQKDFFEAKTFLADRAGIELDNQRATPEATERTNRKAWLRRAAQAGQDFFRETLHAPLGQTARQAIVDRGISEAMVDRFELGASPPGWDGLLTNIASPEMPEKVLIAAGLLKERTEGQGCYDAFRNRLMFPIHDDTGRPIAFGARALDPDDQPKYLNSCEHDIFHKGQTLYGLHLARPEIVKKRQAIVTEGYTDVIACHGGGICNVVATLGTALTDDHARRLARLCDELVMVFDGDEAGQSAAERAVRIVFRHPVDVKICVLEAGLDPDDLMRQADGPARFRSAVEGAFDAIDYLLHRFTRRLDEARGVTAKQRMVEQFLESLRSLGLDESTGLRRSMLINRIADLVSVPPSDIEAMMKRKRPHAAAKTVVGADDESAGKAPEIIARRSRQVAEGEVLAVTLYRTESFSETKLDVPTVLDPSRFVDPTHRSIALILIDLLHGNPPTMQAILGRMEDEGDREVASRLYFTGERLVLAAFEQDELHPLNRAANALASCEHDDTTREHLAQWRSRDDADDRTAVDIIEHLKSHQRRPSAILRNRD